MSRTPLSYYSSYYVDTKVDPAAVTNHGGIFPYLDMMLLLDLPRLVSERLPQKGMRAGLAMPKGMVGSRFADTSASSASRDKRLRFHLINMPARLVTHVRQCCVRYFQATTLNLVQYIRGEIVLSCISP